MNRILRFANDFARQCDMFTEAILRVDDSAINKMVRRYNGKYNPQELRLQLGIEYTEYGLARELIKGKLISFSASLAEHISRNPENYMESVDYRVPFPATVIHFDRPLPCHLWDENESIEALLFLQNEITPEIAKSIREDKSHNTKILESLGMTRPDVVEGEMNNAVIAVFSGVRMAIRKISWQGGIEQKIQQIDYSRTDKSVADGWNKIRQLAISCIGYINCENVYLYTPENTKTNAAHKHRKTEKRPYYTCRIRGVNYDNPVSTGKGTSPGHIFDVRGHFRRLDSGRVTWVRPHLRGLKSGGEYIPKVYEATE